MKKFLFLIICMCIASTSYFSVNAKKIQKVSVEKVMDNGKDMVLKVKNNNKYSVTIYPDSVDYFKDGEIVDNENSHCGNLFIKSKGIVYISFNSSNQEYDKLRMNYTSQKNWYKKSNNIKVSKQWDSDSEVKIRLKKNKKTKNAHEVYIQVLYYKDGNIVGFMSDTYKMKKKKGERLAKLLHPYNLDYENIEYDSYKVFVDPYIPYN